MSMAACGAAGWRRRRLRRINEKIFGFGPASNAAGVSAIRAYHINGRKTSSQQRGAGA